MTSTRRERREAREQGEREDRVDISPTFLISLNFPTPCKMRLILYTKPGCHLCEGLQEKLEQIRSLSFELEIRDITTREDWFQAYQYEVPVLCRDAVGREEQLPRLSPRATVRQIEQMLQKYITNSDME